MVSIHFLFKNMYTKEPNSNQCEKPLTHRTKSISFHSGHLFKKKSLTSPHKKKNKWKHVRFSHSSILLHLFPSQLPRCLLITFIHQTVLSSHLFLELTFNFRMAVHSSSIEECQAAYFHFEIEWNFIARSWLISCLRQTLNFFSTGVSLVR